MATRREFSDERKREVCALWQDSDRSMEEVSRMADVTPSLISQWLMRHQDTSKSRRYVPGTPQPRTKNPDPASRGGSGYNDAFRARAVKGVRLAMKDGLSLNKACDGVSDMLKVHTTTVRNWFTEAEAAKAPAARRAPPVPEPVQAAYGHVVVANGYDEPGRGVVMQEVQTESGQRFTNLDPQVAAYIRELQKQLHEAFGDRDIGIRFATMLGKEREQTR